jgi:hypothetical protein
MAVGVLPMIILMPKLNRAQVTGESELLKDAMGLALGLPVLFYLFWSAIVRGLGPIILNGLGSRTTLPGISLMLVLAVITALELNHSIFASFITTRNRVRFAPAAMVSGACILLLSLIVVIVTPFGILGRALARGLVQLLYNDWRWPRTALTELGVTWTELLRRGSSQVGGLLHAR